MKSYLFYDLETTGLSKSFDQVLQFAAIRTDLQFNELERHEICVKLNPDVTPSPYATITHHINTNNLRGALCEYEAMLKIHGILNTPGTISLGYNTLGFDDEFLRFSFYRNLLTPYTHQFANSCARMDIYPMTVMYFLYKNDVLTWPMQDNKASLKLENLIKDNNLARGRAHDAMVDVEATLALAKILSKEKSMWEYLTTFFNKKGHMEHVAKLPFSFETNARRYREGLVVSGNVGARANFIAPTLFLGSHDVYKNQLLWLRLDLPKLQKTIVENVPENTWVVNSKQGEPGFILPIQERFTTKVSSERQAICEDNKKWLAANPDILQAIVSHYVTYTYPEVPNVDIDAALYINGFQSDEEQQWCRNFHAAALADKPAIIASTPSNRLQTQAIRILGRNYPELLNDEGLAEFNEYLALAKTGAPIDFRGNPRYAPTTMPEDIATIRAERELTEEQQNLLQELEKTFNFLGS